MKRILEQCTGFEWDEGNQNKNWVKHTVSNSECEQVFFNLPHIVRYDAKHSKKEARYFLLGQTDALRLLFVVFTIRTDRIRIISARDMNKKEKVIYNEQLKKNS
jgi:hypothetical protein